jgi:hypothetical protein
MLRLKSLSNKFQKRTLRVEYSQTNATPVYSTLDPSLGSGSAFVKPLAADTTPLTRSADAFTYKNGLLPGTVMVRNSGDNVCVASGSTTVAVQPFGLLANFVGGDLDELGDEVKVGVWRGIGSTYTLLAPAYDDTGLAAAISGATAGVPVLLYAAADGRLKYVASPTATQVPVARVVERVSSTVLRIDLLV